MNPSLRKLVRKRAPNAKEIDAFVGASEFPLVDGSDITFVYRGSADSISLRCWISGFNAAQPFQRLQDTDLWALSIELPLGSRIEYKFELVTNGQRSLIVDPLNPVLAHDPFGANSVCQVTGYERPAWSLPDPGSRRGTVEEQTLDCKAFGESRTLQVYLPARFRRTRRYPLLIVHDGADYTRFADLITVLDNLIQSLEIPPMVVVMTQSPDRLKEYGGNDKHAAFIGDELLTYLSRNYPLIDEPRARGLMGASFGAVAALHAAWKNPGVFDCLLLQSGSFAFSDLGQHERGPVFDSVVRFMNEFREQPGQPAGRIYMNCGIYESLIYENRSLVPRLQQQGIEVLFEEARDAHNWENWRDRLRNGLTWLYPGPVWMVYE